MMRDDFIEQKDIAYFDHIHKKKVSIYIKTQPHPFIYFHLVIQMMCFIFKMQVKLMEFMSYS
jgi:hypothetical protein